MTNLEKVVRRPQKGLQKKSGDLASAAIGMGMQA
jgi:hypothetical protein